MAFQLFGGLSNGIPDGGVWEIISEQFQKPTSLGTKANSEWVL